MKRDTKLSFHEAQILIASVILLYAMFTYRTAPVDRTGLYEKVAYACLFFLFGKFTNGWHRSKPTRWDDVKGIDEDGQDSTSVIAVFDNRGSEIGNPRPKTWRENRRDDPG